MAPRSRCPPTITAAGGKGRHLWRAVDYEGRFIDVRLKAECDAKAAEAFLERTPRGDRLCPDPVCRDSLTHSQAAQARYR
ncbi:DDE-type integrase/transposase/recombinase [uncultured Jannaschia sp.]|uniref:DDE-type integrase/transposase/recombinase n=1 Tax=uncultured Jannaschia sp. TaxID=293347 RepID=UPI00342FA954